MHEIRDEEVWEGPAKPEIDRSGGLTDAIRWVADRWLPILGVTFLLIGLGFLFKYTYERGLLIPPLRVLSGVGVGGVLAVAGWRVRETQRTLSQALLGGASAVGYLTLYAATQMYDLIGWPIGFGGAIAVTLATFWVSLREESPVLSHVATLGGFATPFLVGVDIAGPAMLNDFVTLAHMCLVMAGATTIFVSRGWSSLMWNVAAAMGSYLLAAVLLPAAPLERWGIQSAILATWFATGVVPVLRTVLVRGTPGRATEVTTHVFALVAPAAAMGLSRLAWAPDPPVWWALALVVAGAYGIASIALWSKKRSIADVAAVVSVGFLTMALVEALTGSVLMVSLLAEGLALIWLSRAGLRTKAPLDGFGRGTLFVSSLVGHALATLVTCDSLVRLLEAPTGMPFLGGEGPQLIATVFALFAVGRFHADDDTREILEWPALLAFLAVALHQPSTLALGDLLTTALWGVVSIAIVAISAHRPNPLREATGIVLLLLTAAKLLLFDMSGTETLWRVLLSMGFGSALLILHYAKHRLRPTDEDAERGTDLGGLA